MSINEMKITILSFQLARMLTFCWTTTLRSTSRSRPTQISRRPIARAMRLTRLGWTLGLVTGTVTFRMWTWASGLTLRINAGISMAGAIRLGRPIAGATRLGGTSGGQTWTTFRMVRASSTSPSTSWPGASRFLRKSHIAIYLLEKKEFFFVNETKVWNFWNRKKLVQNHTLYYLSYF